MFGIAILIYKEYAKLKQLGQDPEHKQDLEIQLKVG